MSGSARPAGLDVFDLAGLGVLRLLGAGLLVVWWMVLFPMVSVPLGIAVAVTVLIGWPAGVLVAGVLLAGMVGWRRRSPHTFERAITGRARTRYLVWSRYRRDWVDRMTACGLTTHRNGVVAVPRLLAVRVGESVDRVRVGLLPGQAPADIDTRLDRLAHTFGAQHCRAVILTPGVVELVMRHRDSLAAPIILPGHRPEGEVA